MGKLTGKRVVVTGGGQGLGAAIVEQLIDEGCVWQSITTPVARVPTSSWPQLQQQT